MAKPPNKPPGDYEVGYGRPPKGSQFQPGQCGNRKGRPKGQPTVSEIFMREAARLVRIQIGDKVETISRFEAVIRKLFHMAMAGDARAMGMLLGASSRWGAGPQEGSPEEASETLSAVVPDEDALRRMLSRFDYLKSV